MQRIEVRGQADPVELTVRTTSHGVILNDIFGPATRTAMDLPDVKTDSLLALRWTTDVPDRALAGSMLMVVVGALPRVTGSEGLE